MPCQAGKEAAERLRVDRLDLATQRGERAPAQHAQHTVVAPLRRGPAGPELADDDAPVLLEPAQRLEHPIGGGAEPARGLLDGERTVRARVAGDELVEREGHRFGERDRKPGPDGDAEPVAQPRRIFGGRDPLGARDPHADRAPLRDERVDPLAPVAVGARRDLVVGEIADVAQQVVQPVEAAGVTRLGEVLELELELRERLGIEQLAQLLGAEQLAQQIAVEREGGGAAFGQWRVAVVHAHRDPREQQRLRERRRAAGLDRHDVHAAAIAVSTSRRPPMSNTSRRHSRVVSSSIGNAG